MTKLLKNIIGETYFPKNKDEQDFMKKHVVTRFDNMYSGSEYDKLFGATETKQSPREADRHGYSGSPSPEGIHDEPQSGNDAKVYESYDDESEMTGTYTHHDGKKYQVYTQSAAEKDHVHVMVSGREGPIATIHANDLHKAPNIKWDKPENHDGSDVAEYG